MKVMQSKLHIITLLLTILFPLSVFSAGDKVDLMEQKWPFNGIFGRFDNTALQRGFIQLIFELDMCLLLQLRG